jgi:hypothetical protein
MAVVVANTNVAVGLGVDFQAVTGGRVSVSLWRLCRIVAAIAKARASWGKGASRPTAFRDRVTPFSSPKLAYSCRQKWAKSASKASIVS